MKPANLRPARKVANLAARQRWQIRSNVYLSRLQCPRACFLLERPHARIRRTSGRHPRRPFGCPTQYKEVTHAHRIHVRIRHRRAPG
jgi:hypothetical protein